MEIYWINWPAKGNRIKRGITKNEMIKRINSGSLGQVGVEGVEIPSRIPETRRLHIRGGERWQKDVARQKSIFFLCTSSRSLNLPLHPHYFLEGCRMAPLAG